jgi:ATP-dependent DNA helicase HFM1/MER3
MKNLGTPLRFLAVSATVPNIEDVASWLGAGGSGHNDIMPEEKGMARVFKFNDEFRPCPLQK